MLLNFYNWLVGKEPVLADVLTHFITVSDKLTHFLDKTTDLMDAKRKQADDLNAQIQAHKAEVDKAVKIIENLKPFLGQ